MEGKGYGKPIGDTIQPVDTQYKFKVVHLKIAMRDILEWGQGPFFFFLSFYLVAKVSYKNIP